MLISSYKIRTKVESTGKYYCADCKTWFDDLDIISYDEPRGEYWGIPCSERVYECYCPNCGSSDVYDEANVIVEEEDEND